MDAFWADEEIDAALAAIQAYNGPEPFVISDLTDEEWSAFVAALAD